MARSITFIRLMLVFLWALVLSNHAFACGYNFVGECSSNIHLRINHTLDSFAIALCPSGARFDGLDLGMVQSLSLANAKVITWESCQNNVTAAALWYRIYPAGMPEGAWSSLDLPEDYNTLQGPYTTRYRSHGSDIDLTAGLIAGKSYVLEVYFKADVDTIGDDFIPETVIFQNNNGQNYRLGFTYGGANAPVFALVKTAQSSIGCYSDTSAHVAVKVYGNQDGLFYHWSNKTFNNYGEEYNLGAGNYTVTVSVASGYTQSATFSIPQPDSLSISFVSIFPLTCNNSLGQAIADAGGGVGPYKYLWNNGLQHDTLLVTVPGSYELTLTDANGCHKTATIDMPYWSMIQTNVSAEICKGQDYTIAGQTFSLTGNYMVTLPGNNACDTLLSLNLKVIDPGVTLEGLPDTAFLNCHASMIDICTNPAVQTSIQWFFGDTELGATNCLAIDSAGLYHVISTQTGNLAVCSATRFFLIRKIQPPQITEMTQLPASGPNMSDGSAYVVATGGLPPFTYHWSFGGLSGSFITNLIPGQYCVTVSDAQMCTTTQCVQVGFTSATQAPVGEGLSVWPNLVEPGNAVRIILPETIGMINNQVTIFLVSAEGRMVWETTTCVSDHSISITIPAEMPSGMLFLRAAGLAWNAAGKLTIIK
jgi:hypothetical protein